MFISNASFACDICGCFMGLTPYDNQSNFGVLYRYRSFHGYNGQNHATFPKGSQFFFPKDNRNSAIAAHHNNSTDYEIYRTMEVRGRYFVHQRIEFNAILPYNSNTEQYNNQVSSISGLGDLNLYAGYHLIRKLDQERFNQRLILGVGLKLPTGKNDVKDLTGIRYSALMQPGTGSTDGFVYANYLVGLGKLGLSINSAYKVNGENNKREGIANSSTTFVNVFFTQKINKSWQIVPSVQLFHEYSKGETYIGKPTGEHQMNNLMAGCGADVFYKNVALNVGLQRNIWEAKTDHPMSAAKMYMGITYNLNQLYYLLKS